MILQNEKNQILSITEKLSNLSKYSFKLGIANTTATIDLSLDPNIKDEVNVSDFLYFEENGSPLKNILPTKPLSRTFSMMQSSIARVYDDIVEGIVEKNYTRNDITFMLKNEANQLVNMAKTISDKKISNYIICDVLYEGIKV